MADVAQQVTGVGVVVQPLGRNLELLKGELLADVSGLALNGQTVAELHAGSQNAVVLTGGNILHGLIHSKVAGAAGLGVVNGGLASHAHPLGNLHIGSQVVGAVQGRSTAVVVEVHILGVMPASSMADRAA